jgi:hypothetical protein
MNTYQREYRSQDENGDAPVREVHEQAERQDDADYANHEINPPFVSLL